MNISTLIRRVSVVTFILLLSYTSSAINFKATNLTHPNGTDFELASIVAVEFVPCPKAPLLLVATFTGTIHLLQVWHPKPFRYFCRQLAQVKVPDGRSIQHITPDPFTPMVFFVSTAITGFTQVGLPLSAWTNAQVLVLKLSPARFKYTITLGTRPLLAGLPVSNYTFGTGLYATEAANDGALFVFQALHTNLGAPGPPIYQEDSYYSGTVLTADVRTPGKTGVVEWDSEVITKARPVNENVSGISLYATGTRSIINPVVTTRGHLYVTDLGGDPPFGQKSVSCDAAVPLAADQPDRIYRVRPGRWYGAANRVRGQDDPQYCVYLWGDEANLTKIKKAYPDFTAPRFNTAKALKDGIINAGLVGFAQYLSNWFPSIRERFIATEFDGVSDESPSSKRRGMVVVNVWSGKIFKIADVPGTSITMDRYGSIFVGQFSLGKIGIVEPVVTNWMRKQPMIRNVWPTRGKPGTQIIITGTKMAEAAIEIEGQRCIIGRRRRDLDLQITVCSVPKLPSYSGVASDIRVGKLTLKEAFTVLPPTVNLEYDF